MSNLLETYEAMKANAQAEAQAEEIQKEAEAVVAERADVLQKYASVADELLAKEYGDDYKENDVVELAQHLINHDIEQEQAQEKVAEYAEAGAIMARAFLSELESQPEE